MNGIGRIILEDGTILDMIVHNCHLESGIRDKNETQVWCRFDNQVICLYQRRSGMPEPLPGYRGKD